MEDNQKDKDMQRVKVHDIKEREKPAKGIQHGDIREGEANVGRNTDCDDDHLALSTNYCFH